MRLHVPPAGLAGGRASLTRQDSAYLLRVLRLRAGDRLQLFDGIGGAYPAEVVALGAEGGELRLLGPREVDVDRAVAVSLWQGLPKGEKMEWVIQKATELGVAEIVPLRCARSVAQLAGDRMGRKLERWQKVAVEAARQCGRSDVPPLRPPAAPEALWALARSGTPVILLHDGGQLPLARALAELGEIPRLALAVGPEGGFDPEEVRGAKEAGVRLVGLGKRVLRTETAAIVACALVAGWAGDFEPAL